MRTAASCVSAWRSSPNVTLVVMSPWRRSFGITPAKALWGHPCEGPFGVTPAKVLWDHPGEALLGSPRRRLFGVTPAKALLGSPRRRPGSSPYDPRDPGLRRDDDQKQQHRISRCSPLVRVGLPDEKSSLVVRSTSLLLLPTTEACTFKWTTRESQMIVAA